MHRTAKDTVIRQTDSFIAGTAKRSEAAIFFSMPLEYQTEKNPKIAGCDISYKPKQRDPPPHGTGRIDRRYLQSPCKKAIFPCAVGRVCFSKALSKEPQLMARLPRPHHKEDKNG